jgi:hypothetical protein
MKKLYIIFFLCFGLFTTNAQHNTDITIGKIDSLNSKIVDEQRKIWIHVPEENSDGIYQKKKYPVVYLLDGDDHFSSIVGMIERMSSESGGANCPQMIVVGIPNTNRWRDLTPTKAKLELPRIDSVMVANSGGGENFMSFIEKELIPYIDSKYPTDPYRMFIGHSLGGLTVMNTLINKPNLFNAYVAIDPSMSWDDTKLLQTIKKTVLDKKYSNKRLFLGIANTMTAGMDTISVKKDTTEDTRHIRAILELDMHLKNDTQKHLSFKSKYYKEDDHGSVTLIAGYDAMRAIFDFYQFKFKLEYYDNPESDFATKVESHYKQLSKEFGREIKPDEDYLNTWGYRFLNMKQFKKSEQFFKLYVKSYPKSYNAYDSLGDFYVAIENKDLAIENYKKSISLDKDASSKDKLKKLEEK